MADANNTKGDKPAGGPPDGMMIEVDGVMFPRFFQTNRPMKEHIECIKSLELRPDDVILCAFPKSGTHWLWEVGSMLLAGRVEYQERSKEFAMLEATPIESTQQLPSPRILNTHIPVDMLPAQVLEKKVKVIHVYRNLKDVMVSTLFHLRQYDHGKDLSMQQIMDMTLAGHLTGRNDYFQYLRGMEAFMQTNPDVPVFNISFEDTKQDPVGVITKLAEFLGVAHTPDLVKEVAEACSFHKMKKVDLTVKKQLESLPPAHLYRKGEVGDWKNHLTVAQSERLDEAMKQMEGTSFRFRYTL